VEVARADAFEVEIGNQLLDALGLTEIGRQELGAELLLLTGRPTIVHSRLLDDQLAQARDDLPLREIAVADHLAAPPLIGDLLVLLDPLGDLRLNGLREHFLSSLPQNLLERIPRPWQTNRRSANFLHGGVSSGKKAAS
jgi:hypothetical protein